MTAVFVPVTFMTGPVGIFYRQFSITMATSIVLSGVVALTLTPVLCAMILKHDHGQAEEAHARSRIFLDAFNRAFERVTGGYASVLRRIVTRRLVTFGMLLLFGVGILGVNTVLPAGFIPSEDQGMIYAIIQTPPGSTLEHTNEVSRAAGDRQGGGRRRVGLLAGRLRGPDRGPRLERRHLPHQPEALVRAQADRRPDHRGARGEGEGHRRRRRVLRAAGGARATAPRAASRFACSTRPTRRTTRSSTRSTRSSWTTCAKRKELTGLFTFFAANYPQYELVIDNEVAMQKGVSIEERHGQPQHPRSAAPTSRASSASASSSRSTSRRRRSSGGSPRTS